MGFWRDEQVTKQQKNTILTAMPNTCVPTITMNPEIRSAYSLNGLLGIPPSASSHSVPTHPMQQPTPLEASAFNPMYPYSKAPLPPVQGVPAYSHQPMGQGRNE